MANVEQNTKDDSIHHVFQYVCELVFGVDVLDLNLGVQIDSLKQPIKSNCVVSGNMSHGRASSLYDHRDHCFIVFANTYNKAS